MEKYITENGCDPVTGAELKIDQLIEIKSELSGMLFNGVY